MTKQVKLFGLFEIEEDGETISAQNSPKGVALLAYLLVTRRQQSREAIADLLWEASSTAHGLQNLRKHLSRVRKWLPELHIDRQRVGIKPDASLDVDLYQLEEGSSHPDLYERAKTVLLYRGELLSGFYLSDAPEFNAWLTIERERLHRKMGSRLGELCGELFEAQLWDLGVQTASHWVTLDELDEESSQWLMRFLDAQGNMSAAKAEFDRLASALKRELGIQPSEQTAQLYDQLISDRETIPEDNQPLVKVPPPASTRIDWGEAPTTEQFVGREAEIEQLSTWIIDESARVVTVLGIGGQGKTSLAVALVQRQANQFETIFWRSLVNAPPLSLVLREYINFLDPQNGAQLSDSIGEQLNTLRDLLQSGRHLLVLDNLETILDKDQIGRLQPPYQAYEDLFTLIASTRYGTTLLMTSRESPTSVRQLDQKFRGIYEHALVGLDWEAGFSILQSEGSALSSEASEALTLRYSGNPLALKLVSKTIEAFYFGDVEGFLADSGAIFDDIRVVLEQQFERLSPLEQEILYWLAVRREATIPSDLEPLLTTPLRGGGLINGLQRLERRSLLERDGRGFALQNVITEFLTDRIVLSIGNEFQSKRFDLLSRHALTLSDSKEYIRQSQARILLGGVAQELAKLIDYRDEIKAACAALLDEARQDARLQEGYLPGNLLNLLIHMGIDLKGMDFSDLHLRQLYLRDVWLHDVDFSFSTFDDAVFSETFGALFCIAYHPSGQALAMGTRDGDIYAWGIDRGRPTELLKRFPHHPDDPNNRSLPTHVIRTVAFSPDGRLLAAGSYNYAVRIWDYAESKVLHTLETGSEHPGVITFSPDGQLLATGYAGFGFALWEVESGALRKVHYGHEATLKGCAFHPDGELVATCSDDFTVGLWEVESGRLIQQLKGHSNIIGAIAWSSDGRWLATGSRDHTIRLWDMEGLDAITSKVLTGHNNDVTHIAFHGSSAYLISGSVDHTVRIWQVPTGEPRHLLQQHTDSVYGVAASPDGRTLASGSVDLSLTIWEFQSGQPIYRLQGSGRWSRALDIDPSGGRVASGSADGLLRVWEADAGSDPAQRTRPLMRATGHSGEIFTLAYSRDGRFLASGGLDQAVHLWRTANGKPVRQLNAHTGSILSLRFSPDDRFLASSSIDHTIVLWDVGRGRLLHRLTDHLGWVYEVEFDQSGETLLSVSTDRRVLFWDVSSGQPYYSLRLPTMGNSLNLSPDNKRLAVGLFDGSVHIWDVEEILAGRQTLIDQKEMLHGEQPAEQVIGGEMGWVWAVRFSPDGKYLATGSEDKQVRLWELKTERVSCLLSGHSRGVYRIAFSQDSRLLASSSSDEKICLWEVATGRLLGHFAVPGLYEGLNVTGVSGLSDSELDALLKHGAVLG